MRTQPASDLLEYLQDEPGTPLATSSATSVVAQPTPGSAPRVPLELEGAIWSAIVERIAERSIELIVDRAAAGNLSTHGDATIYFQPDNSVMQQVPGRITKIDPLTEHRLRLNFELS